MSDRHVTRDFSLPSDLSEVHRVQAEIEEALQANRFGDSDVFAIKLAVEEALVNAIKHGNQMEPDKTVRVAYTVNDEQFSIRIEDEGLGFSPAEVPDPTAEENIERPCGRGLLIIRNFMTSVDYVGCGNVVVMFKVRDSEPSE